MVDTIAQEIKDFVVSNFLFGQNGTSRPTVDRFSRRHHRLDRRPRAGCFWSSNTRSPSGTCELLPENLDSIQNVSRFVSRKLANEGAQVAG
jgi:hypothetical protein